MHLFIIWCCFPCLSLPRKDRQPYFFSLQFTQYPSKNCKSFVFYTLCHSWMCSFSITVVLQCYSWVIFISNKKNGYLCSIVSFSSVLTAKVTTPNYLVSHCVPEVTQHLDPCQLLTMARCVCKDLCYGCELAHMHALQLSGACKASSRWPQNSSRLLTAWKLPSYVHS